MPGTALSGDEKTEWMDFLKDMDATRRNRFADMLAAAPDDPDHKAYTFGDLRILPDDDVKDSVADIKGFRLADVRYFMNYWKAHLGHADMTNQPVLLATAMAATTEMLR